MIYKAKLKWIKRNYSIGFKVGQIYEADDKLYKVVEVGTMVSFECNDDIICCKPKCISSCKVDEQGNKSNVKETWFVNIKGINIGIYQIHTP